MRRRFLLTLLSLSLFPMSTLADQVTLKNGDRLTGMIVKTNDDVKTLLVKSDLAGEVTIAWDAITAIVSTQTLHITLSDGRVVVGTVSPADGKIEVATKDAGTVSTAHDAQQAEADRLQHPRLRDYWSGMFDLGLSLTEGNSSTSALTIAGKAARFSQEAAAGERCVITVEDNGIGFEDKHAERVFAAFQRLHSRSAYEGTGIGLSIARKIVWRHGGDITAQSAPEHGSTFTVTLPLSHGNGSASHNGSDTGDEQ